MINDYVHALKAALTSGQKPETVFRNLETVLEKRWHRQLLPRILRTFLRELGRGAGGDDATLTVARATDAKSPLVAKLVKELDVDGNPTVVIDETIIGGVKLRANHAEIDATYKTALINLYHTITK